MINAVLYIHGKDGNAAEADHYKELFPFCDVFGLDYKNDTPWAAGDEIREAARSLSVKYENVILVANSIGAFFAMSALSEMWIEKAYFISPVVNMENLIANMMTWANVTEEELRDKGEIDTSFGETLSWEYLCYVREHPVHWTAPTHILYGAKDNLTPLETISAFANQIGATLTIMEIGEHRLHTEEQMRFIDD